VEPILILSSHGQLNAAFTPPATFMMRWSWTFIAPLLEYRPATSRWGVMLQAGYDSRKGSFDHLHVIVLQT
jgi:hypothetical protein